VFEWDSKKADSNEAKHGVSFEEASTAFFDHGGVDGEDLAHSAKEEADTDWRNRLPGICSLLSIQ
jgi:uncharacterized DUF497 family protein